MTQTPLKPAPKRKRKSTKAEREQAFPIQEQSKPEQQSLQPEPKPERQAVKPARRANGLEKPPAGELNVEGKDGSRWFIDESDLDRASEAIAAGQNQAEQEQEDSDATLALRSMNLLLQRIEQLEATQGHQQQLLSQQGEVIKAQQALIDASESGVDPIEARTKLAEATGIASLLDQQLRQSVATGEQMLQAQRDEADGRAAEFQVETERSEALLKSRMGLMSQLSNKATEQFAELKADTQKVAVQAQETADKVDANEKMLKLAGNMSALNQHIDQRVDRAFDEGLRQQIKDVIRSDYIPAVPGTSVAAGDYGDMAFAEAPNGNPLGLKS